MSRLTANLLLLGVAFIWGTAFVAQKTGLDSVGAAYFVGFRFLLTTLFILPFAWHELQKKKAIVQAERSPSQSLVNLFKQHARLFALVALSFFAGSLMQQQGLTSTSVTNAGFLTGLYVILAPLVYWAIERHPPNRIIWPCAILSLLGLWLLSGGTFNQFTYGDWLIIASSFCWALHFVFLGRAVMRSNLPVTFAFMQFLITALLALLCGIIFEPFSLNALLNIWPELLYTGIISAGIGFTLQAIAQQYTSVSNAAILLSAEVLFAALAGALLLGERLSLIGWLGGGLILLAIILVQIAPQDTQANE